MPNNASYRRWLERVHGNCQLRRVQRERVHGRWSGRVRPSCVLDRVVDRGVLPWNEGTMVEMRCPIRCIRKTPVRSGRVANHGCKRRKARSLLASSLHRNNGPCRLFQVWHHHHHLRIRMYWPMSSYAVSAVLDPAHPTVAIAHTVWGATVHRIVVKRTASHGWRL